MRLNRAGHRHWVDMWNGVIIVVTRAMIGTQLHGLICYSVELMMAGKMKIIPCAVVVLAGRGNAAHIGVPYDFTLNHG